MTAPLDDFAEFDTLDLADLVRRRQTTATELANVVINRIETLNPVLNFMSNSDFDRARERAATISPDLPFAGVPFLVKDMIDVGGLPRTDGSRLLARNIPKTSVAYIDAVEAAGLNILGLTNVPEFASFARTDNALFGATSNPWNLAYSTFTSSGGSAAAVAAGVVSMAHGTDGAGSNRLPASATGVFGMKPSRTRMRSGEADGGHDVAKTNHVLSRTVRESAALFALTEDPNGPLKPVGRITGPSAQRLQIGVLPQPALNEVAPDVQDAIANTVQLLIDAGHSIVEIDYPADHRAFARAYTAFFAAKLKPLRQMVEQTIGQAILESDLITHTVASAAMHLSSLDEAEIAEAMTYLSGLSQHFGRVFCQIDLLLTPVSPVVCPLQNEGSWCAEWTDEVAEKTTRMLQFTAPVNFAGLPAMSMPLHVGARTGMPVGSHFIASMGGERQLFELAYALERASPWKQNYAALGANYALTAAGAVSTL